MMVWRLLSFWGGNLSGTMLNFRWVNITVFLMVTSLKIGENMTHDPFNQKVGTGDLQESGIKFDQIGITSQILRWDGNIYPGGGFKHFLFSPLPGEMIQFD